MAVGSIRVRSYRRAIGLGGILSGQGRSCPAQGCRSRAHLYLQIFWAHVWRLGLLTTWMLVGCTQPVERAPEAKSLVQDPAGWMDRSHPAELAAVWKVSDCQDFKDGSGCGFGSEPVCVRL